MPKLKKRFEVKNKAGKAKVKLIGDISWWRNSSEEFTRLIDGLLDEGVTDVDAYINSPGGDMDEGNEIGNQFARFPGHKYVKLGALCASAATTITTVFDEIECAANISYMIHDPMQNAYIQHEEDFDSHKKRYKNLLSGAIKSYVKLTERIKGKNGGLTTDQVSEMMRLTTWMNAEELLEKGFVHKVADEDDTTMPEDAQDVANKLKFTLPDSVLGKIKNNAGAKTKGQENPPSPKPAKTSNNQKETNMKNFIVTFLATFGVVNVSADSSDDNVFNALKSFVENKIQAMSSLVDQLKSYEGFKFNADNLVQSVKDFVKLKDDKISDLQGKLDQVEEDKRSAIFDIAKNQKGFTEQQIDALKEMSKESSVEALVKFLDQSKDTKSLSQQVQKEGASNSSTMAHAINARLAGIKSKLQTQSN